MPAKFNLNRDPAAGLVPEGVHRFTVEKAIDTSSNDVSKVNLHLRVFVNGQPHPSVVFDTLSGSEKALYKVNQFFDAVGAPMDGNADAPWFRGKSAWAKFVHGVDQDGLPRTEVKRYLNETQAESAKSRLAAGGGADPMASRAAPNPNRKTGGKKAEVAEMDDDGASPF